MADSRSTSLGVHLDIKQILVEAQHRWLRPAEICEILGNYMKFDFTPEPPDKPLSGSVFLFDRKAIRYFRKDGHSWRKKKDGKTVKEAHEKLKVGSVDKVHCYYAHGEENENFQRRCYWLLEQELMHIVFVHYLEVKGSKISSSLNRNSESMLPGHKRVSSSPFIFSGNGNNVPSTSTDSTSPISTQASASGDAESIRSPEFQSEDSWVTGNLGVTHQKTNRLPPHSGYPTIHVMDNAPHQYSYTDGGGSEGLIVDKQAPLNPLLFQGNLQNLHGDILLHPSRVSATENLISDLAYDCGKSLLEQKPLLQAIQNPLDLYNFALDVQEHDEIEHVVNQESEISVKSVETVQYSLLLKQSLFFLGVM